MALQGVVGNPPEVGVVDLKPCVPPLPCALHKGTVLEGNLPRLSEDDAAHNARGDAHGPENGDGEVGEVLTVSRPRPECPESIVVGYGGLITYLIDNPVENSRNRLLLARSPLRQPLSQCFY